MTEGIIITISQQMLKERGVFNWAREFLETMNNEEWSYWMRQGAKPKRDINYVYLCIGGKIRYRAYFAGTETGWMTFENGEEMYGKVWIIMAGPVEKPIHPIPMKGFQGFRYCEKLF